MIDRFNIPIQRLSKTIILKENVKFKYCYSCQHVFVDFNYLENIPFHGRATPVECEID